MHNPAQTDSYSERSLTPKTWFEKNIKFRVPVYQRLFTWEKPQFDRLLSDLNDWDMQDPYYLGIITVVEMKDSYVLIDGQQRLTVIAILMGMFRNDLPDLNQDKTAIDRLDYEARPNDRIALKEIWDNGEKWCGMDQEKFANWLPTSKIASDSMRLFIKHIYENKCEWHKLIKDKDLFRNLKLLISCLPKDYDIKLQNEYFEKMNSAGKQLEPHEILKVRICKLECDFENWNRIEDFTEKYKKKDYPKPENNQTTGSATNNDGLSIMQIMMGEYGSYKTTLENKLKNTTESSRTTVEKWRPSLIDFPMFLLHVLKYIITLNMNGNKAFSLPQDSHTLLKKFEENGFLLKKTEGNRLLLKEIEKNTSSTFVCCMSDYRMFLDEWIIHKEMDPREQLEEDVKKTGSEDNSTYSYWSKENTEIKTIVSHDPLSSQTMRELKQIQMTLYALGGQKQEWMIDAYIESRSFSIESFGNELLQYHVQQLVQQLPNNNEQIKSDFKKIFLEDYWPHECLTYTHNSHALFMCLDYFLWLLSNSCREEDAFLQSYIFNTSKNVNIPPAVKYFVPKANRSVEHFHPQTDERSYAPEKWSNSIHMFGNLALISAGKNSEYGNQPIPSKFERIKKLINEKNLESIKLYLMGEECQGSDERWNPQCACLHAQKMLKVLKWGLNYYNIPDNTIWGS